MHSEWTDRLINVKKWSKLALKSFIKQIFKENDKIQWMLDSVYYKTHSVPE